MKGSLVNSRKFFCLLGVLCLSLCLLIVNPAPAHAEMTRNNLSNQLVKINEINLDRPVSELTAGQLLYSSLNAISGGVIQEMLPVAETSDFELDRPVSEMTTGQLLSFLPNVTPRSVIQLPPGVDLRPPSFENCTYVYPEIKLGECYIKDGKYICTPTTFTEGYISCD